MWNTCPKDLGKRTRRTVTEESAADRLRSVLQCPHPLRQHRDACAITRTREDRPQSSRKMSKHSDDDKGSECAGRPESPCQGPQGSAAPPPGSGGPATLPLGREGGRQPERGRPAEAEEAPPNAGQAAPRPRRGGGGGGVSNAAPGGPGRAERRDRRARRPSPGLADAALADNENLQRGQHVLVHPVGTPGPDRPTDR